MYCSGHAKVSILGSAGCLQPGYLEPEGIASGKPCEAQLPAKSRLKSVSAFCPQVVGKKCKDPSCNGKYHTAEVSSECLDILRSRA